MESEIETNSYEANRIIKEFEKRAKENEMNGKNLIPSKTTRLIEKFEKKSQSSSTDGRRGSSEQSVVNNMKKVFEPNNGQTNDENDVQMIPSGSTNKLIGIFQTSVSIEEQKQQPQQSSSISTSSSSSSSQSSLTT